MTVNADPKTHEFESTGEGYDALQCDENIKDGDILIVPSEKVVGIAVEAWPVAITAERGEFAQLLPGRDWSALRNGGDPKDYSLSFRLAQSLALELDAAPVTLAL